LVGRKFESPDKPAKSQNPPHTTVIECETAVGKLLAKMSGGDLSSTILRIYQTLAVEFQTARAEQIYTKNRRYVANNPPLPPSSLLHHIPPIVHPPPLPLPPPNHPSNTSLTSAEPERKPGEPERKVSKPDQEHSNTYTEHFWRHSLFTRHTATMREQSS
jgi:hypothetical protein